MNDGSGGALRSCGHAAGCAQLIPQGMPRTASRSRAILVDRFSTSMHAVQACRSRQERTEPGVRTGRTAAVRNEHSTAIPERARKQLTTPIKHQQSQPTKRNHPSIRPTSNHETTIINTPQVHQPAQTAITSR